MDIRGIWKVKEVHVPTPDGEKVFTPDNPPEDEMFEEMAAMMQWRTEFADDGALNTLMFVPEEMKAEAAKHGVDVRDDGYAVIDSTQWRRGTESSSTTQKSRARFWVRRLTRSSKFP